jgi:rhamnose transport system permease protein
LAAQFRQRYDSENCKFQIAELILLLQFAICSLQRGANLRRYKRELAVAAAYAVLLLVLAWRVPAFYQGNELRNILVNNSAVLVAAVGMTLVMLTRHIDISIGLQWAACGVIAGLLARAGLPMPLVIVATLLCGALLGAINGALVAGLGLPSIVVTLATVFILREALRWAREGESIKDLPPGFQWFGLSQLAGQWLVIGIALFVLLCFAWGLRYIAAGRAIYATGSDAEAAFLAGMRPRRVVFGVFVLMGAMSALAALLNAVRFPDVEASAEMGTEIQVIAAVVVGGVAVSGGRGTLIGPLLGVLLLGTIGSALVFLHIDSHWAKAIQGGIILIAVTSDVFNVRRKRDVGTGFATS